MNTKGREVDPVADQTGIMIATEIVEVEMTIKIREVIIRTPNATVKIEINPLGNGIDHHLKAIREIKGTTETPIPLIPPEGHRIEIINDHRDLTQETINDHLNFPDTIAEVTLDLLEIEEDHQDPSLGTIIDQGIDDLEDEVTPVHTQEVVIDSIEGIDLPVGTIIEDQVTTILLEITEDTRQGQDHTPIQDIDHRLMSLPESPEIQGCLLQGHTAEDIIMIAQD